MSNQSSFLDGWVPPKDIEDPDEFYVPLSQRGFCQRCIHCAMDFEDGLIACNHYKKIYGQFAAEKCEKYKRRVVMNGDPITTPISPTNTVRKRKIVDMDEVMRLAALGHGTCKICSAMKMDTSTLMDRLRSSGLYDEYKKINAENNKKRPKRATVDIDRVFDLARKKNSKVRICHVLGIDKETLIGHLTAAGRLDEFYDIMSHRNDHIDAIVAEAIRIAPECRSIPDAAYKMGCNDSTLYNHLMLRGKLEEFHSKTRLVDIEEAFRLAGESTSLTKVAIKLNVAGKTLYKALESAGRYDEFIESLLPRPVKVRLVKVRTVKTKPVKTEKKVVKKEDVFDVRPKDIAPTVAIKEELPEPTTIDTEQIMSHAAEGMTLAEVASLYDLDIDILRKHLIGCGKLKEYVETSRPVRFTMNLRNRGAQV